MSEPSILANRLTVSPDRLEGFANWQALFNTTIASFPGFVSLEIQAPRTSAPLVWVIVQRFINPARAEAWRSSRERSELFAEAKELCAQVPDAILEINWSGFNLSGGVTEVIITDIKPGKEFAYRQWISNIHRVEAQFPGFQGAYIQSPDATSGHHWITLLQFDTPENLDHWLNSKERQTFIKQSEPLLASFESHRVVSPYAGWFASLANSASLPPVWKQTMLILLVLFPIVMLELKYLSPLLTPLNFALATFISNAISVSLVSWPTLPTAIKYLNWWLVPKRDSWKLTLQGTAIVFLLYLIEILVLWNLF